MKEELRGKTFVTDDEADADDADDGQHENNISCLSRWDVNQAVMFIKVYPLVTLKRNKEIWKMGSYVSFLSLSWVAQYD